MNKLDDWTINMVAINLGAKSVIFNKDKKEYTFFLPSQKTIVMTLKEVKNLYGKK